MNYIEKAVDHAVLDIRSTAFRKGEMIPEKYTCDGINVNPPLQIGGIPPNTVSLAIVLNDPDGPIGVWTHWLVWNLPVKNRIEENKIEGTQGLNDFQQRNYGGPCPPSGTHRYIFKVYALDAKLVLPSHIRQVQLEKAMRGHIIGYGELMGFYKRRK